VSGTPPESLAAADEISADGGTPLLVADSTQVLGVVHLKDIVKPGIAERFADLRAMGIRTVMITGDSVLTAQSIAKPRVPAPGGPGTGHTSDRRRTDDVPGPS